MTWANVDPDLCRCMVSLGHNELISITGPRTSTGWLMTTLQWHHMSTMESQITGNSIVYLTHWGWDEMSDILQMTFQINFSYENCRILILISLKFIPTSPIVNKSVDDSLVLNRWQAIIWTSGGKLTIIGLDNGLSPGRRQAIIRTNVGILLIGSQGTNFNEILIEIHISLFKKIHLKMSSGKWQPFCLSLNVLIACSV